MTTLEENIRVYTTKRDELERDHNDKWVVINGDFLEVYDTFEAAAEDAVSKFGEQEFHLRQIGERIHRLPSSFVYGI